MSRKLEDTLQKAPNDCWYAIEKIGEGLRDQGGARMYATAATDVLTRIIADFKTVTKELGEDWEENDGLANDLPELEYAIEQLGKFLRGEQCDIVSARSGEVFREFVRRQLHELVDFAKSVDRGR